MKDDQESAIWKPVAILLMACMKSFMIVHVFCAFGWSLFFTNHIGTLLDITRLDQYCACIIAVMLLASMKIRSYWFSALGILCYALLTASFAVGTSYLNIKVLYMGFSSIAVALAGVKLWLNRKKA